MLLSMFLKNSLNDLNYENNFKPLLLFFSKKK